MKVCIVGPGAIGGSIAHRFAALKDLEVCVLARGAHLAAIQRDGLTMIERGARATVRVGAAQDPAALGAQDVVILALKAYSLTGVAPTLAPLLKPDTVVVSVQNGIPWWYTHRAGGALDGQRLEAVDPGGVIGAALDPSRVLGAVTYGGARVPEPGVIDLSFDEVMVLGEPDGSASRRLATVAELFARSGFKTETSDDIRKVIWMKLWGNATMNPASVLVQTTMDRMIHDPAVKATLAQAMVEVREVAGALGFTFELSIEKRFEQALALGAFKTSMLQDLEAGRPLEIEALVGIVVELARKVAVKVPVIETFYSLARLRGLNAAR
ncbi:MAG: 2-dehydropantoate 2-reductase [Alphaproteobacteria bacterium]|nr:2-dehydropantoate 2-reductase [Alphaproteobacteria bacterium]